MFCKNCGAELRPGAKFCSKCGKSTIPVCKNCGTPLQENLPFCTQCGFPTGQTPPYAPFPVMPDADPEEEWRYKKRNHRLLMILGLLLLLAGLLAFLCLNSSAYDKVISTFSSFSETVTECVQDIQSFFGDEGTFSSSAETLASSSSAISSDIVSSSSTALSSNSVPQTAVSQFSAPSQTASSSSVSQEPVTAEKNINIDPGLSSVLEQLMNACEKEDIEAIRKVASSQPFLQLITEWSEKEPSRNLFYGNMQDGKGVNIKLRTKIEKVSHTISHTTYSSEETIETEQTILDILYGHWHDNEVEGKVLNYQGYVDVRHTDNSPFLDWEKNYPLSWSVRQFNVLHENIAGSASGYSYTKRISNDYTICKSRGTIDSEGYWHGTLEREYTTATHQKSESEEFNHGYFTTPGQESRRYEPVFWMSLYKDLLNTSNSSAWNDYVRNKESSSSTNTTLVSSDTSSSTVKTSTPEYSSSNINPDLKFLLNSLMDACEKDDYQVINEIASSEQMSTLLYEWSHQRSNFYLFYENINTQKGINIFVCSPKDPNAIRIDFDLNFCYGSWNNNKVYGKIIGYNGFLNSKKYDKQYNYEIYTLNISNKNILGDATTYRYLPSEDNAPFISISTGSVDNDGFWNGKVVTDQYTREYEHGHPIINGEVKYLQRSYTGIKVQLLDNSNSLNWYQKNM